MKKRNITCGRCQSKWFEKFTKRLRGTNDKKKELESRHHHGRWIWEEREISGLDKSIEIIEKLLPPIPERSRKEKREGGCKGDRRNESLNKTALPSDNTKCRVMHTNDAMCYLQNVPLIKTWFHSSPHAHINKHTQSSSTTTHTNNHSIPLSQSD